MGLTGPEGPKGDTGDEGPKGDTGDEGPKGDDRTMKDLREILVIPVQQDPQNLSPELKKRDCLTHFPRIHNQYSQIQGNSPFSLCNIV